MTTCNRNRKNAKSYTDGTSAVAVVDWLTHKAVFTPPASHEALIILFIIKKIKIKIRYLNLIKIACEKIVNIYGKSKQ